MKLYTEVIWQSLVSSRYQLYGYSIAPDVSCQKMCIPASVSRDTETLLMSLFYQNNLMNSFLHRYNKDKFYSPLCSCQEGGKQDALHILTRCKNISQRKRQKMIQVLDELDTCADAEDHIMLLNCSRSSDFITICTEIMVEASLFLRTKIQLASAVKDTEELDS